MHAWAQLSTSLEQLVQTSLVCLVLYDNLL